MIGLDTTAIIDIFNGEKNVIKKIGELREPLVSTIINYQEIFFGIDFLDHTLAEEKTYYDSFFDNVEVFGLTMNAAKEASNILWSLRKKGHDIGEFDSMIAGILLSSGVNKIMTKNVKHFESIDRLKVISY